MTSLSSLLKEEPRKVCFTYDLFLNLEGNPPVNHLRCEKLTFNNPTIEFRYKLLMAGGVSEPLLRWAPGAPAAPAWLRRGCWCAAGSVLGCLWVSQARLFRVVGCPRPGGAAALRRIRVSRVGAGALSTVNV